MTYYVSSGTLNLTHSLILIRKLGQTDLVLVCDQGSLVGLCVYEITSLCVQRLDLCHRG